MAVVGSGSLQSSGVCLGLLLVLMLSWGFSTENAVYVAHRESLTCKALDFLSNGRRPFVLSPLPMALT